MLLGLHIIDLDGFLSGPLNLSGQGNQGLIDVRSLRIILGNLELGEQAAQIFVLGGEGLHTGFQCGNNGPQSVLDLFHSVLQVVSPFVHGIHSAVDVPGGAVKIVVGIQILLVHIVQQSGRNHGSRKIQGEVCYVRGYLKIFRDVYVFRIAEGLEVQDLAEAGQHHAHGQAAVVHADGLSICDLHIGKHVLVQGHQGHSHQGHRHRIGLFAHLYSPLQLVFVIKADHKVAGFPRQGLRGGDDAVHRIAHIDFHGQRCRICVSLIVDILPLILPGQGAVGKDGIFLIPFRIPDVRQDGLILDRAGTLLPEDHLHLYFLGLSRRGCRHMDSLLLVPVFLRHRGRLGGEGQAPQ